MLFLIIERRARSAQCTQLFKQKFYYVTMYKEKLREIGSMPTIVRRIGFALWLIVAFRQRNG